MEFLRLFLKCFVLCSSTNLFALTVSGKITEVTAYKGHEGMLIKFDSYQCPAGLACTHPGIYILPKTHPLYQESLNLLLTAAVARTPVGLVIDDKELVQSISVINHISLKCAE